MCACVFACVHIVGKCVHVRMFLHVCLFASVDLLGVQVQNAEDAFSP